MSGGSILHVQYYKKCNLLDVSQNFCERGRAKISLGFALLSSFAVTREQCRAARGLLGWSMDRLAKEAEVARETIHQFENAVRPATSFRKRTIRTIRDAFERNGVKFLDDGEGPGLRLVKTPKRSSNPASNE